jgi:hypothetical protein
LTPLAVGIEKSTWRARSTEPQLPVEGLLELTQDVGRDPTLGCTIEEEVGSVEGHEHPDDPFFYHCIEIAVERLHQLGHQLRRFGGNRRLLARL